MLLISLDVWVCGEYYHRSSAWQNFRWGTMPTKVYPENNVKKHAKQYLVRITLEISWKQGKLNIILPAILSPPPKPSAQNCMVLDSLRLLVGTIRLLDQTSFWTSLQLCLALWSLQDCLANRNLAAMTQCNWQVVFNIHTLPCACKPSPFGNSRSHFRSFKQKKQTAANMGKKTK